MNQVSNSQTRLNTVSAKNLADSQAHLLTVVSSQRFLKNEGLNNEVPFHICPFEPEISEDMSHAIKQLKNELDDKGIGVLEINLYDLVVEILKEEGDWEILERYSGFTFDDMFPKEKARTSTCSPALPTESVSAWSPSPSISAFTSSEVSFLEDAIFEQPFTATQMR